MSIANDIVNSKIEFEIKELKEQKQVLINILDDQKSTIYLNKRTRIDNSVTDYAGDVLLKQRNELKETVAIVCKKIKMLRDSLEELKKGTLNGEENKNRFI